jgi:hypothetical protein
MRSLGLGLAVLAALSLTATPLKADTNGGGFVGGDGFSVHASPAHPGFVFIDTVNNVTAAGSVPGRYEQSIGPGGATATTYAVCTYSVNGGPLQVGVEFLQLSVDLNGNVTVQRFFLFDINGNIVDSTSGPLTGAVVIS